MSISMNSVFSGGWENIKKNPILFVPNALSYLITLVITFAIQWFFIRQFSIDFESFLTDPYELEAFLMNLTPEVIFPFILIVLLLLLFSSLLSYYLQAGLIGMSYDAAKTGKTKISSLFSYGNKYFIRIFFASILLMFLLFLPLVVIYSILIVSIVFLGTSMGLGIVLLLLTLLLFLLYLPYLIVVIIYTYFILYAIVIDDTPVIESFRKSKALFKKNKSDVIVFIVIIIAVSIISSIILAIFSLLTSIPIVVLVLQYLIEIFINVVLATFIVVWGTQMYLALTGNGYCEEQIIESQLYEDEISD